MKIAVYQTDPVLLDLKTNLEEVIEKIKHGREQGAQLIVFPELALTGYPPPRVPQPSSASLKNHLP